MGVDHPIIHTQGMGDGRISPCSASAEVPEIDRAVALLRKEQMRYIDSITYYQRGFKRTSKGRETRRGRDGQEWLAISKGSLNGRLVGAEPPLLLCIYAAVRKLSPTHDDRTDNEVSQSPAVQFCQSKHVSSCLFLIGRVYLHTDAVRKNLRHRPHHLWHRSIVLCADDGQMLPRFAWGLAARG